MVDNTVILDIIAGLVDDLGYSITYDDIDSSSKNVMGIYLREAGNPIGSLDNANKVQRVDLSIRLHGDVVDGSQVKCSQDLITIAERLVMYNKVFNGVNILGCSLRGRGTMIGKTSKKIPVYNISFLITLY